MLTHCDCSSPNKAASTGRFFTGRSKWYSKKFKSRKLERVQRLLVDAARQAGTSGARVLDIGCGVGALHLTLLRDHHVVSATGVDMSPGMLRYARQFAEKEGMKERTEYIEGDFVEVADKITAADITILDKVVCCYGDLPRLIHTTAAKTKRLLVLSHPRENWLMEPSFKLSIFVSRLFRMDFVPYWHDWQEMGKMIESEGLQLVEKKASPLWQILVYQRT